MSYNIKSDVFEGPMDLLLHLVKKEEVDIYKVSIAKIIDEYLDYIKVIQELDLNIASSFLIMASALIEIKSKMLLPKPQIELVYEHAEECEEETINTPEELLEKIIEYEKFKKIAEILSELEKTEKKYVVRPHIDEEKDPVFYEVTVDDLVFALHDIISKKQEPTKILSREAITVDDMKEFVMEKIKKHGEVNFMDLFSSEDGRLKIIMSFIAILELIFDKKILARQESHFSHIILYNL